MRVRAAETPKYATKQMRSEDTIPMGMALWGFFTSSPGGAQEHDFRGKKCRGRKTPKRARGQQNISHIYLLASTSRRSLWERSICPGISVYGTLGRLHPRQLWSFAQPGGGWGRVRSSRVNGGTRTSRQSPTLSIRIRRSTGSNIEF